MVELPRTMLKDEQLIERIAAGDRAAFAELYDRHADRVLGTLVRQLGSRADAEDVLQEVFCQVWTRASAYAADRGSPIFWLLLIARSRGIDFSRRRRPVGNSVPDDARMETGLIDKIELREVSQRVGVALGALPEEQRAAIRQAFYAGMTHEEIAHQQSLPLGTVKTRIRLGILRLREMLADERQVLAS